MLQIIKMAWRDLGRNRRRSFFSALALGLGVSLLLLMAAVVEDEIRTGMATSIRLQSGHLQVRASSYDEDKASLAWSDLLEDPGGIAARLAALPQVSAASPRLYASGILALGDSSISVRVMGVDPAAATSAPFRESVVSGAMVGPEDREGVVIGQGLATRYSLATGDRLTVMVNTSNGDVDQQAFIVRGIYSTKTPAFDDVTVLMPLAKAQAITGAGNRASLVLIMLKDRDQADAVAAAIQGSGIRTHTWQSLNRLLTDTESLAQGFMIFLYLIILGITATVVVNTLVMAVFERTREIGILSALGMRRRQVMALFFAESALLALGGIAIGVVLGVLFVALFSAVGVPVRPGLNGVLIGERLRATLTLRDTLTLSVLALIVTLISALYPARMAARMEPVEALRGGKQA
ncbi:MAG: ABC transporter permease [Thermoflexales bacterium]|nr:ABC transporter permease [Thermoflexales bacterium]